MVSVFGVKCEANSALMGSLSHGAGVDTEGDRKGKRKSRSMLTGPRVASFFSNMYVM